ncbi:Oidioi.mRNA.OKI2018_I69.chr2.g7655.t1.cds [Oikopleura dioica]|uniref:Oidioi.mRNA.OKI2018_I69.chr2.g7655.t1.cds n=1 Tax=Oikopleura dioica TaxID=34765 RepID=A0ABN7TFN7_OIKDI|nr:Oidioi.mRNA.OKI2018_I69.chr2.g7655.t1.cds [Oikopleura dioica]
MYEPMESQKSNGAANRGFAFVEFETHMDASTVKKNLLNRSLALFGRYYQNVDWADPENTPDDAVMSTVKNLYVKAMEAMNGKEFDNGEVIDVTLAKPNDKNLKAKKMQRQNQRQQQGNWDYGWNGGGYGYGGGYGGGFQPQGGFNGNFNRGGPGGRGGRGGMGRGGGGQRGGFKRNFRGGGNNPGGFQGGPGGPKRFKDDSQWYQDQQNFGQW